MNINEKIVFLLRKKKISISIAESCTGGMFSSAITSVSGSSKIFSMGLVTYSNKAKIKILGVRKKIIKTHGAVSRQCCLAMVNNLYKISKSKLCISITGIAGPKGGSVKKPVGLVYVGLKLNKKVLIKRFYIRNNGRKFIQNQTIKKIFQILTLLF
jgi:PncC family amidohydrolase